MPKIYIIHELRAIRNDLYEELRFRVQIVFLVMECKFVISHWKVRLESQSSLDVCSFQNLFGSHPHQ
ncbi:hypothetical protein SAMN03080594_103220 [Arenibacter palladensis]|uniref:Uncharacterized protein n=1 Tax=Arenibacter palladensis TaxID=237373 RepID=A0A1M5AFK1_9FLAO|nr:hypothetical protein SAMN03080594_103220 [Arenibacter palladensis]